LFHLQTTRDTNASRDSPAALPSCLAGGWLVGSSNTSIGSLQSDASTEHAQNNIVPKINCPKFVAIRCMNGRAPVELSKKIILKVVNNFHLD
jgi:hypothetical protein